MSERKSIKEAHERIAQARESNTTELDLSGCTELRDLKPLADLATLQSLNLSRCRQITDIGPLAGLTALQSLNLSRCRQITDFGPLAGLTALHSLYLSGCRRITETGPLAGLTALISLELRGFEQIEDIGSLAKLTALQSLDLSGCGRITDIGPLEGLAALRSLYLSGCGQITDIDPLEGLTALRSLDFSGCWRIAKIGPLARLIGLRSLNLGGCKTITEIGPLAGLTALQTLNLSGCGQITDIGPLAGLIALESLNLRECGRIAEIGPLAGLARLKSLNLRGCKTITEIGPLAGLTALQTLNLSGCGQITDIGPLAGLIALESLNVIACGRITDIGPLAGLARLKSLNLSGCGQITDIGPLAGLARLKSLILRRCGQITDIGPLASISTLQRLIVYNCGPRELPIWLVEHPALEKVYINQLLDIPVEVQSKSDKDNCHYRLTAWWRDKEAGALSEFELKVFLLGNGGVGKTQLCRLLQELPYDDRVATTHGVQIASLDPGTKPLEVQSRLNVWDFGGQDVYHGTHTLFLKSNAIFLILWTPALEIIGKYTTSSGLELRHYPLKYWLDYVRQNAGAASPVLIIQSQCENPAHEQRLSETLLEGMNVRPPISLSVRTGRGTRTFVGVLHDAIRDLETKHRPVEVGRGWISVRDELRRMLREEGMRTLDRSEFDTLCHKQRNDSGTALVSTPSVLLEYLHHTGVIFHQPTIFGGKIILDQSWALDAIYTVFDRERCIPVLRDGSFTRSLLEILVWGERNFSREEQNLFISMMESCGICFRWKKDTKGETVWIAPELLPTLDDVPVYKQLIERLEKSQERRRTTTYRYRFLHDGIVRGLLCSIGRKAGDAAVYWRGGFWVYEETTDSYAVIKAQETPSESQPGCGFIAVTTYGRCTERVRQLLHKEITKLEPPPEAVEREQIETLSKENITYSPSLLETPPIFTTPAPAPPGSKQAVYISFAWGDDTPDGCKRAAVVERLCAKLDVEGFHVMQDKRVMRTGDSIRAFMKNFSTADHVFAVISDKYLRSPHCMTELYSIWQNCGTDPNQFRKRVHPIILEDAQIDTILQRAKYVRHWQNRYHEVELALNDLGFAAIGKTTMHEAQLMAEFALHVMDMLAWLNDILTPRNFDGSDTNEFNSLIELLR